MAKILTITSGKGGVGKTSISLNLALTLASKGYKVCIFDADLGLANVNILTGIYPEKDLASVLSGECSLDDIIIKDYKGIDIIPGSSGVEKIADLTRNETRRLIHRFLDLENYHYFIFDTSAGISSQVLSFCMAAEEIVLVATCEPTSLTDAYAMLKVLSKYKYNNPVKIVINQVKKASAAKKAYNQLKITSDRFLNIHLEPLGIMAADRNVRAAVLSQTPFVHKFPATMASKCIRNIAKKLTSRSISTSTLQMDQFWARCFSFLDQYQDTKKKHQQPSKDAGLKTALSALELKLDALTRQVTEIKKIIEFSQTADKKQSPPVSPEFSSSNILDFEFSKNRPRSKTGPHESFHTSDKKPETIVRGRLRNPTMEELAHWNEFDDPIVRTDQSG